MDKQWSGVRAGGAECGQLLPSYMPSGLVAVAAVQAGLANGVR